MFAWNASLKYDADYKIALGVCIIIINYVYTFEVLCENACYFQIKMPVS